MYQYQQAVKTQGSVDALLRKMTNLTSNHFSQPGIDGQQAKILADYIKLLGKIKLERETPVWLRERENTQNKEEPDMGKTTIARLLSHSLDL